MLGTGAGQLWHQRRLSRRAGLRAGSVTVLGSAAWLAACGGGGDKQGSEQGDAPVRNVLQEATGQAKRGGTFTNRVAATPPLDPHTNTTFRAQGQAGYVYSRLLRFKTGIDPKVAFNYEIEPDLAQSVEMVGDGTQLTFKLQPNAAFHNKQPVNGRPVTSEDVKFSLERFRTDPKNSNRNAFGSPSNPIVESVETPDAQTFVVKLAQPFGPIQNLFANPQYLWIMPREIVGGFDPGKEQIGSGPWVLNSLQPDVSIEFSRNPNWFVKDRPYIDTIKTVIVPDVAQEIAQFQAERLDVAAVPAQTRSEVERSSPRAQWISYIPTTYTFISPQQREGSPFRDERLRRALSMAIDRPGWIDLLYLGKEPHFLNFVPASMGKWWLDPQGPNAGEGGKYFKFDAREAKRLADAAGLGAQPIRFIYTNNIYGESFNQGAEATAGMLNAAGLRTNIVVQDYLREYIASGATFFGGYEGVFYGLQTPFTAAYDYLFNMLHSASARNHAGVKDAQLDGMIEDAGRTLNEEERIKKVHTIQRYAMEKMYYVPVAVGAAYTAVQPWLKNYQYSATYGYAAETYPAMWIDRG